MGLITGLVCGVCVGIAMVGGLSWLQKRKRCERMERALAVAAMANMDLNDVNRLSSDGVLPSWVSFLEYEKVKWINFELKELWPHVNKATMQVIKEQVEPLLATYCPPGIKSMKFKKLTLGNLNPSIEGIKVVPGKGGQATMELMFQWQGDPSIILAIEPLVSIAPLQVQVKDIVFSAMVRMIFQFADDIPCIGAVAVSLRENPPPIHRFKLRAIGGNLNAIPGLVGMIEGIVEDVLNDIIMWPQRIVIKLIEGDYSDLELKLAGKLTVHLMRAENLKNTEVWGKSDSFVKMYTRLKFPQTSRVINDTQDPVWDETFELQLEDPATQKLVLKVMDMSVGGRVEALGVAAIGLGNLEHDKPVEVTVNLLPSLNKYTEKKDRGTITVKLTWHKYTEEEQEEAMAAEAREVEEERLRASKAGVLGSVGGAVGGAVTDVAGFVGDGVGAAAGVISRGFSSVTRVTSSKLSKRQTAKGSAKF